LHNIHKRRISFVSNYSHHSYYFYITLQYTSALV
jgi:hypothetical protein